MKVFLFLIVFLIGYSSASDFNFTLPPSLPKKIAKNTIIFWINGDSDRFRPQEGIGSKIIQLDILDASRIQQYARDCNCNIVVFHDQRGSDSWYTNSKYFSAFLYAFSNGRPVIFEKKFRRILNNQIRMRAIRRGKKHFTVKYHLEFDEVNQASSSFLTQLLQFSAQLFPETNYHLIYRGHSFATPLNLPFSIPFDYSHDKVPYHFGDFAKAVKNSGVLLSSITMAACSMAYIELILKLNGYSKYFIASQVNIHEDGKTGFSFDFLKNIKDTNSEQQIASKIASTILTKFLTVEDRELFMRETPIALIDIKKIQAIRNRLKKVKPTIAKIISGNPDLYSEFLISSKVSERYIKLRKQEGLSPIARKLIKEKMVANDGNQTSYDLIGVLKRLGYIQLADRLSKSIKQYGSSAFSNKYGISLDISF